MSNDERSLTIGHLVWAFFLGCVASYVIMFWISPEKTVSTKKGGDDIESILKKNIASLEKTIEVEKEKHEKYIATTEKAAKEAKDVNRSNIATMLDVTKNSVKEILVNYAQAAEDTLSGPDRLRLLSRFQELHSRSKE
jgi:hypothetical protein